MSPQAQNSLALYKGNPVSTIKTALKMQKASIVKELKEHFKIDDLDALALRLSIG